MLVSSFTFSHNAGLIKHISKYSCLFDFLEKFCVDLALFFFKEKVDSLAHLCIHVFVHLANIITTI